MADFSEPVPERGVEIPPGPSPRDWKEILVATWRSAGEDNLDLIAAGVAFFAFLAFVPLLSAFMMTYGLVADPVDVVDNIEALTRAMPDEAATIVGDQLIDMAGIDETKTGLALLLALAVALWGASRGAGAMITALNIAYEVEENRGFFRRTLVKLTMAAGGVVVLFMAMIAITVLKFLATIPELRGGTRLELNVSLYLVLAMSVLLLLAVIYRYGPNRREARWRWITPGSAIATLVWLAATAGFGAYVANFGHFNATYGSLGAVIVFLSWLYLSAYIVLYGAELNSILEAEDRAGMTA